MADILHDFPIEVSAARVFWAISTPEGLDHWWTKKSTGHPVEGAEYELWFGPQFDWRARVTKCIASQAFELEMIRAGEDWLATPVGFCLDLGSVLHRWSSTTPGGPNLTSIFALLPTAGRCTYVSSSGI
jgi:hypothetical protein